MIKAILALLFAVVSLPAAAVNFVTAEIPVGKINGNNAKFTLAHVPDISSVTVYRNGIRQIKCPTCNYTFNVNSGVGTIIFMPASVPHSGDSVLVDYRWLDVGPGRIFIGQGAAPTSTVNPDDGMTYDACAFVDVDGKLKVLFSSGKIVVLTP